MINFNFNNSSVHFVKAILLLIVLFIITLLLKLTAASRVVGFVLLLAVLVFTAIVLFEHFNDKYRMKMWQKDNENRITIDDNKYECARCGSRTIIKTDTYCSNCAFVFKNREN